MKATALQENRRKVPQLDSLKITLGEISLTLENCILNKIYTDIVMISLYRYISCFFLSFMVFLSDDFDSSFVLCVRVRIRFYIGSHT